MTTLFHFLMYVNDTCYQCTSLHSINSETVKATQLYYYTLCCSVVLITAKCWWCWHIMIVRWTSDTFDIRWYMMVIRWTFYISLVPICYRPITACCTFLLLMLLTVSHKHHHHHRHQSSSSMMMNLTAYCFSLSQPPNIHKNFMNINTDWLEEMKINSMQRITVTKSE